MDHMQPTLSETDLNGVVENKMVDEHSSPRERSLSPARDKSRSMSRSLSRGRRESPSRPRDLEAPTPSVVLGVFGLSLDTRERHLEDVFCPYGKIEKVILVYDRRSDRSRGFGFINFTTIEDATTAKERLNGIELHGRRIRVDYSMTQRPHAPTPGHYMGRRRLTPSPVRRRYRRHRSTSGSRTPPRRYRRRSRSVSRSPRRGRNSSRSRSPPIRRGRHSSRSPRAHHRRDRSRSR